MEAAFAAQPGYSRYLRAAWLEPLDVFQDGVAGAVPFGSQGAHALAAALGNVTEVTLVKGLEEDSMMFKTWAPASRWLVSLYAGLALLSSGGAVICHYWENRFGHRRGPVDKIVLPGGHCGGQSKVCPCKYYRSTICGKLFMGLYNLTGLYRIVLLLLFVGVSNYKGFDFFVLTQERTYCKQVSDSEICYHDTWDSLLGPYISIFIISRLREAVAKSIPNLRQTLFMTRCSARDAEFVMVYVEGDRWHACPVTNDCGSRMCMYQFFPLVFMEDKFMCKSTERLTQELLQQRRAQGGLTGLEVVQRRSQHGTNLMHVHVPGVRASIREEFDSWFYVYQFSCIWWFAFEGSLAISSTWAVLTFSTGLFRALWITRKARLKTFDMTKANTALGAMVFRNNTIDWVLAMDLVPGDLVVIDQGITMPCDCLLVDGSALVDEAMLTGESLPSWRTAAEQASVYESESVTARMLLGGSRILESEGIADIGMETPLAEGGRGRALAIARFTGGMTVQASLVREWQNMPPEGQLQHFEQIRSLFAGLFFVFILEMGVMVFVYFRSTNEDQMMDLMSLVQRCINLFLPLINPMVGVVTCLTHISAVKTLSKKGISCLLAPRIAMAGRVDTMVFDKTGTITEASMSFLGVDLNEGGCMGHVYSLDSLSSLGETTCFCLSACSELCLEKGEQTLTLGKKSGGSVLTMKVLRIMNFSRENMISGCICRLPNGEIWLFIKGAAGSIQEYDDNVPRDFIRAADQWGSQCLYVLGCSARQLMSEEEIEEPWETLVQHCEIMGLLLFMNQVKPDSKNALEQIRNAGIRCVMCTGDSLCSGVSVARLVGLIPDSVPVYRVQADGLGISTTRISKNTRTSIKKGAAGVSGLLSNNPDKDDSTDSGEDEGHFDEEFVENATLGILEEGVFGIEQEDWAALLDSPSLPFVLDRLVVFGRMPPGGKVSVVRAYQELGQVVGMCGDGSNDCAAMCAAHVGLAVGSGAGSALIAPFHTLDPQELLDDTIEAEVDRMKERSVNAHRADVKAAAGNAVAKLESYQRQSIVGNQVWRSGRRPTLPPTTEDIKDLHTAQISGAATSSFRMSVATGSNSVDRMSNVLSHSRPTLWRSFSHISQIPENSQPKDADNGDDDLFNFELVGKQTTLRHRHVQRSKSLLTLVDLLIQGRCVMATHTACFCYFVVWSICLTQTELLVFYLNGCSLGSGIWFFADIILSVLLPMAMAASPAAAQLSDSRPTGLLAGPRMRNGVGISIGLFFIAQATALIFLWRQDAETKEEGFYVKWDNHKLGLSGHLMNRLGDNYESEVLSLIVITHIAASALANCLSSRHRAPLLRNKMLLLSFLLVWTCLCLVLFGRGTKLNAWSRINCDGETLYREGHLCFIGPQLRFWQQGDDQYTDDVRRLVLRYRPRSDKYQYDCINQTEMELYDVPQKYRDLKNITNVLPEWFSGTLCGLMVVQTFVFLFLYERFVMSDKVDKQEESIHNQHMNELATKRWLDLDSRVTEYLQKDKPHTNLPHKSFNFDMTGSFAQTIQLLSEVPQQGIRGHAISSMTSTMSSESSAGRRHSNRPPSESIPEEDEEHDGHQVSQVSTKRSAAVFGAVSTERSAAANELSVPSGSARGEPRSNWPPGEDGPAVEMRAYSARR